MVCAPFVQIALSSYWMTVSAKSCVTLAEPRAVVLLLGPVAKALAEKTCAPTMGEGASVIPKVWLRLVAPDGALFPLLINT